MTEFMAGLNKVTNHFGLNTTVYSEPQSTFVCVMDDDIITMSFEPYIHQWNASIAFAKKSNLGGGWDYNPVKLLEKLGYRPC